MLKVQDLTAGYGKLSVLHGVEVEIPTGSLTAFVGPNGAGKTSLMSAIMGVIDIMAGEITFERQVISGRPPHTIAAMGIGYVPQVANVFPSMTVQENLELTCYLLGSDRRPGDGLGRIFELFPRLGTRRGQKAVTLSGGERQMLALGSALLGHPRLLILDEPITGLAPQVVEELIQIIIDIRQRGTTVGWVVEENPLQVLPHADVAYVMEAGTISLRDTGPGLVRTPDFARVCMGSADLDPGMVVRC